MACIPYSDVQPGWEMAGTPHNRLCRPGNRLRRKIHGAIEIEGQGAVPLSQKRLDHVLPTSPATRPLWIVRFSTPPSWRTIKMTRLF